MIKRKHWKGWIILSKREKAESYEKKEKERPNGLLKKKKWKGQICMGDPNIHKIYIIYYNMIRFGFGRFSTFKHAIETK